MRRMLLPLLAAALVAAAPAAPKRPEFPPNEAGRHAVAWFEAYNKGDDAMKAYLGSHVAPAALKRRTLEDRMEIYHDIRDARGKVTPLEVKEFTDSSVRAIARGERGGRFAITFRCEEEAPHKLLGLQIEDLPPEEGTPEGADDGGYSGASPGPAGPAMTAAQVVTALHAYVDSLAKAGSFSGAVLLAKGDRVLAREAYGLASRRYAARNSVDTRFNLGSINKAFTRVAIEQLAAAGKLSLDDTIDRYLTDYPREAASKITIRMLLNHRGGVPDIFGPKYRASDRTSLRTVSDFVALFRDEPLRFTPGTREEYSNGGYVLLGAVVEKVSGMDYYDYVRKHIYEPAGMKETDSYEEDDPVPNVATGYTRADGPGSSWRDAFPTKPGRGSPAGGGYSTVGDLYRFAQALRSGKLGVERGEALGVAGGSPGTSAMLLMLGDWTLVALANLDPPAAERVATHATPWLRRAGAPAPGGHHISARDRHAAADEDTPTAPAAPAISSRVAAVAATPAGAGLDRPSSRPGATYLPDGGVRVPMEWTGHVASVSVMINGQGPFRFGIDTGAAGCARIDADLARRLGLAQIGETMVGDPSGKNMRRATVVQIDSLGIGGARFTAVPATSGDMAGRVMGDRVDGILGFGLFADCLWTLDYPALRMTLAQGGLEDGSDVVPFRDERGIPSVTLRVAGIDVDADVDAGAMGGISLPDALASRLPLREPPRVVGHARTVSNEFDIKAAHLDGDVALGEITFTKPTVEFQPIFPVANVGARILRDFVLTFDQRTHRLRLARSA
jgi:CubicO group peptidase (beta-lactamase class C family)